RIAEIDARMRSGGVAPRDLAAMQTEIEHLNARQRDLEDRTLEAMEEREPLDTLLSELDAARSALDEKAAQARVALAETEVALDAEIAEAEAARASAAGGLSADLLTQYERLRERLAGVGAAPLVGGSCGGCHLSLPATELDRIKKLPADAIVHCEQCGRILVRPG
ncbi:MAG: zinc ribbon domain-containing protein, partial [Acidimicrobiia bacterium]